MPSISIIIPVYNVDKYLEKCLDSVTSQTFYDIEIILVNNGSTDKSLSICEQYRDRDKRITLISQDNLGPSGGRNRGIDIAQGKYIMFVDSDDWIAEDTCETVYKIAEDNNADYVFWSYCNESSSGTVIKEIYKDNQIVYDKKAVRDELLKGVLGLTGKKLRNPQKLDALVPVWARLYKTSIIKNNNIRYIDLEFVPSECQLFNFDYLRYSEKAVYVNKPMYHYRRNNTSSFTKGYRDGLLDKWIYWIDYCGKIVDMPGNSDLTDAYYSRICFSVIPLGGNAIKPKKLKDRLSEMKEFLNNRYYSEAFKHLDLSYFPLHWKVFFMFAKTGNTLGFYAMTKAMRWMLSFRKR